MVGSFERGSESGWSSINEGILFQYLSDYFLVRNDYSIMLFHHE